jgi:hypothetical protein
VRQRGYENVTVDQLASELMPRGRAAVPDRRALVFLCASRSAAAHGAHARCARRSVKAELLKSIKQALQN